jgi:glutaredoxin 3
MMKNVIVYSTDPCSFCSNAKALLRARKIEFDEINLGKDPAGRAELAQKTGMLSFPQVLVDDELVGGFRELLEADRTGRLVQLLAA